MLKSFFRRHAASVALFSLLILLAGICLMADGLERTYGLRIDYSFNSVTTQSETTLEILKSLDHPVQIYALYARGNEDAQLMELLGRYVSASDFITCEQVDISLNPGLLSRFRSASSSGDVISQDSIVVSCEETGRFRVLDATDFYTLGYNMEEGAYEIAGLSYEASLTEAIRYVAKDDIPNVYILQGHGELDEDGTAVFASLLRSNNFNTVYITSMEGMELHPEDVLCVLSPVRDLMDTEMETIRSFLQAGGSLLCTMDYTDPSDAMPNWTSLLRSYGFLPRDGIVIASETEPDSYYGDYQVFLLPIMQSTEITADLVQAGSSTLLLAGTRAFENPSMTDRDLTVSTLLTSTSRAYLRSMSGDLSDLKQKDEDALGPFSLALQAERITDEGNVSRAVIIGCSTLLTSSEVYAMTDAQEFLIRVMEYLSGEEQMDLNIMAKQAVRPSLRAGTQRLGIFLIVLLPCLVFAAALVILLPRIRKR